MLCTFLQDTSNSSSSSVNNSNGSDQLFSTRDQRSSSRVLRDKTNTADKHKSHPRDKKRKPPLLKKGDGNKKEIKIKRRKVTEKKQGDSVNTTCRSDASSDGGAPSQYNFSDLDKYSLIMSDSPVVEHDVSRDRLEAATSLVQTSTPHVGRPSSARLQSVGTDLSIATGSPISSPAVDSPQVDHSEGGIDDVLHVSDMSSIACEISKDFGQLSLADSFVAEIPTGVSLRRRQKGILKAHTVVLSLVVSRISTLNLFPLYRWLLLYCHLLKVLKSCILPRKHEKKS